MMQTKILGRLSVIGVSVVLSFGLANARELTFDERVQAQRAIEDVYWRHRIWPRENPTAKPTLDAVMPESAIRAKVEDYLAKSNALERSWRHAVRGDQLQAEMDRMARQTKDGATLQELFHALGDDPSLIAETFARQSLVDRLIRNWYASDTRFHGELKARVEAAVGACTSVGCMRSMGGEYHEVAWTLGSEKARGQAEVGVAEIGLDPDEWDDHVARLASKFGAPADALPTGRLSGIEDTRDAFVVSAVLAQRNHRLVTASVTWPKRTFDAWWEGQRAAFGTGTALASGAFTLPLVPLTACTNNTWRPMLSPMEGRYTHATVWTGSEMIVWGGYNGTNLNTGGRYNPATDTWTPTSTGANVPSGRQHPTAVWSGSEMIVWGGYTGSNLSSGGRYNPVNDSWTATSTSNVPTGRFAHTAVWTGSRMVIWGGEGGLNNSRLNTGGRYDPVTDSWTPTSTGTNVPAARENHPAVWTGSQMIVWGGFNGTFLNSGARYDPVTDSWTPTSTGANVPDGRMNHTAIWTGTEMIVWGGHNGHTLSTGGRYNPATDSWTPMSTGIEERWDHTAIWTGTHMIVWGGYNPSYISTGGRYDPATDSWTATSTGANVPVARQDHTAVWMGTQMIVWGGNGGPYLNTGGRYDPATDSWTATSTGANVPVARQDHTAVWTGTQMIVWGGYGYANGFGTPWNTGGRYDPITDSWTQTSTGANVPTARQYHTAIWSGSEMIVWGGFSSSFPPSTLNSGGRFNPVTDSWTATSTGANVPAWRQDHTAVWTGTEMVVWGGSQLSTGGRYCACPIVYRDADGDGYGNAAVSMPSCDDPAPAGYVVEYTDCDDVMTSVHPGAAEACDGIDNDCNGLVDESPSGEDGDGDAVHDLCDNCPYAWNSTQSDFDHDGEGDACDPNDGLIFEWRVDKASVSWQAEQGPTSWNLYFGDLDVLKATGVYTQVVGSNPLAGRQCGMNSTVAEDLAAPDVGRVSFSLVTGVIAGVEGPLGSSSAGPRTNQNPCP